MTEMITDRDRLKEFHNSLTYAEINNIHFAIIGSITKWRGITYSHGRDEGTSNCPLCQYARSQSKSSSILDCKCCPIMHFSNSWCEHTPYKDWVQHFTREHSKYINTLKVICETCKHHAVKEIDYLKNLLNVWDELTKELTKERKDEEDKNNFKFPIKVGTFFTIKEITDEVLYMLVSTDSNRVTLISLKNGNYWANGVSASKYGEVNEDEFKTLASSAFKCKTIRQLKDNDEIKAVFTKLIDKSWFRRC